MAGALAVAGLAVLRQDAHPLYAGLVAGPGLPAVIVSGLAGAVALGLVAGSRFALARAAAGTAVAAIVAGWALAQQPRLLPGLSVQQAAAPRATLVAVVVAVAVGALVLAPSLLMLLRLSLRGELGYDAGAAADPDAAVSRPIPRGPRRAGRCAAACLLGALAFLTAAEPGWAHAIGVVLLLAAGVTGVAAAAPALLDDARRDWGPDTGQAQTRDTVAAGTIDP
ncbi:MAG TPA: hypothetical protein VI318_24180 [Baekduia sp.]